MKEHFTYPSADRKTQIHAIEWIPEEGDVRAVLQISHGMVEHIDRYDDFAEFCNKNGIYVVGNDHLGHGKSVTSEDRLGFFAEPDGNACVIGDLHTLQEITAEKYPGIPYFLLGHSMGSFLARQYIELYGKDLTGAIIMGTGSQPQAVLTAGRLLCRLLSVFKGSSYRSTMVNQIAMGSYNKAFSPNRTSHDWLSRNEANVDRYLADPLCGFCFTLNAYDQMFHGIEWIQKKENIDRIPKNLPVFLVSGEKDPVGDFGRGVDIVREAFIKAGMTSVVEKLYPDDRHEILNEVDRETVYQDLVSWILNKSKKDKTVS